jgi:hypothetical protein
MISKSESEKSDTSSLGRETIEDAGDERWLLR